MYIGLPSLGLRSSSAGFSPASLFAAGEQGGWYDPSDISTMFQESTGVTPAAVESPVGLILDKRIAVGAEQVTASTYSSATPKAGGGTISGVTATSATVTSTIAGAYGFTFTLLAVIGKSYCVQFTIVGNTARAMSNDFGSKNIANTCPVGTPQTVTEYFVATTSANPLEIWATATAGGESFTVSNMSVKLVDGNHLTQATAASRPTLSARYNRLTKTELLTDAAWSKAGTPTITGGATDPLGGITAFTVTATGVNDQLFQSGAPSAIYTNSGWVRRRAGSGTLKMFDGGSTITIPGITTSWSFFSMPGVTATTFVWNIIITTAGDAFDFWHPDCRTNADAALSIPAYQRVDTATSYDTSGFPMYLSHDGVDDWTKSSVPLGWGTPTLFWSIGACLTSLPAASTFWDTTRYSSRALVGAIRFTTSGAKDYDDAGYGLVAGTNTVVGGVYDATFGFTPRKNAVPRTLITGTVDSAVGETIFSLYAGNAVGNPLPGRLYQFIMRKAVTDAATMALVDKFVGIKSGLSL